MFLSLFLGELGLPIPSETLLTFAGFFNSKDTSIFESYLYAIFGSFLGSNSAWLIGKKYGEFIIDKYGKFVFITKNRFETASQTFDKNKVPLILFGRFVFGVRHFIPFLSGMSKISYYSFFSLNLFGSLIWCGAFIILGYFFGDNWQTAEKIIKSYSIILVVVVILILLLRYVLKSRRNKT